MCERAMDILLWQRLPFWNVTLIPQNMDKFKEVLRGAVGFL